MGVRNGEEGLDGWGYMWYVKSRDDGEWRECLDPYARLVDSPGSDMFGRRKEDEGGCEYYVRGLVCEEEEVFEWGDGDGVGVKDEEKVVYEVHVRGFTSGDQGLSVGDGKGGFLGMIKRIPYLKSLGVNVVELLPVFEFNEREWDKVSPDTKKKLTQYWGYSTIAFFALMNRFCAGDVKKGAAIREFKMLVRELHRNGMQVYLDVVYNHTAEMGYDFVGPGYYGMKTLAKSEYYLMEGDKFMNFTGCGNTLKCGGNICEDLIVESLRYWVSEFHIDGFRFDLASIMTRGRRGDPLSDPSLIRKLAKDPIMKDVALIAEPWDAFSLYQVGSFPHYSKWGEWNGKYRDAVRRFIKGDQGMSGEFATRLCGSADMYSHGRKPYHSINFVTAHDGFSLYDLCAYNQKHNHANGENNNDGEQHNNSWNCGVEGDTQDKGVVDLRTRQMKNFFLSLLVSAGTPMICSGDEYGHTKGGNNNCWCQEGLLSEFNWKQAQTERAKSLLKFVQALIHVRVKYSAFHWTDFVKDGEVTWHGPKPNSPEWGDYNLLAVVFHAQKEGEPDFYVAWNAGSDYREVELPGNQEWRRVVETSMEDSFQADGAKVQGKYGMKAFSSFMLRGKGNWEKPDSVGLEQAFETLNLSEAPN